MKSQEKQEFLYLHVFVVPLELWLDKYRTAYNNVVLESPSAGFIRIPPVTSLYNVRGFIQDQLGNNNIPVDFIFLRSVGRCLAVVNKNQEMKMKINEFVPPATYSPELFLLPCKHEDVFIASETANEEIFYNERNKSKENSVGSPLDSNDDVPFSSIPNNGMAVTHNSWEMNNNFVMSAAPDDATTEIPKIGIFRKGHHQNSFNHVSKPTNSTSSNANTNPIISNTNPSISTTSPSFSTSEPFYENMNDSTRARVPSTSTSKKAKVPSRPSSASLALEDNLQRLMFKPDVKQHSLSVTPNPAYSGHRSSSPSPLLMQQIIRPEIALIPATPMVNFPLPSAQVIVSRSLRKENESIKEEAQESPAIANHPVESSYANDEKRVQAMADVHTTELVDEETDARRSALEARVKARFEKEKKRLEEEKTLDKNISQETQNELLQQMQELRKKNGTTLHKGAGNNKTQITRQKDRETNEDILSKLNEIGDAKKRNSDEKKLRELKNEKQERVKMEEHEQKKLKLEELKKTLEQVKLEKHNLQRTREANSKKIRSLQVESNNRIVQKQNVWKKKYEEESRQTVELEETLKKLRSEVELQHRKLMAHSSPVHRGAHTQQQTKGAPSERSNQKNTVLRLKNDIEGLKMMTELTTKKLSAESKMKTFAVQELKDLRAKALETKINASRAKKTLSPQSS